MRVSRYEVKRKAAVLASGPDIHNNRLWVSSQYAHKLAILTR
jgi:hypothetical protein